jgi:hypothetical protein
LDKLPLLPPHAVLLAGDFVRGLAVGPLEREFDVQEDEPELAFEVRLEFELREFEEEFELPLEFEGRREWEFEVREMEFELRSEFEVREMEFEGEGLRVEFQWEMELQKGDLWEEEERREVRSWKG